MLDKRSQLYIILFVVLSMILANTAIQLFGNQKFLQLSQERLYDLYGEAEVIIKSYNFTLGKWWNKEWKLRIPVTVITSTNISGEYNVSLEVNLTKLYHIYANVCKDCDINCFCKSIRIVANNVEVPASINCMADVAYINMTVNISNGRFDGWMYVCNPLSNATSVNITESNLEYYSEILYLNGITYNEVKSLDNKIFNSFMKKDYKFTSYSNVLEVFIKDKNKYIKVRENITS